MGSNPTPSATLLWPPFLIYTEALRMDSFYIWTIGCQMNQADSERLASALEQLGLRPESQPQDADVVVLNSCVVRQQAEDKVTEPWELSSPCAKAGRIASWP